MAKNVILAGVRSVTIHDDRPSTLEDLSSQFCLDEQAAQKGEGRARASVNHLRELNPYVDVRLLEVCGELAALVMIVVEVVAVLSTQRDQCGKWGKRRVAVRPVRTSSGAS